jgi:hypothetical protein
MFVMQNAGFNSLTVIPKMWMINNIFLRTVVDGGRGLKAGGEGVFG